MLARDGYAPKALNTRGDRLVYSNGMIILGIVAIGVLIVYQANLTTLIPAVHHRRVRVVLARSDRHGPALAPARCGAEGSTARGREAAVRAIERRSAISGLWINSVGAAMTVLVLVIVTITKFTHGAWLVFIAIPILAVLMIGVNRYYRDVEHEIRMDETVHFGSSGDVAIVLVNRLQKPVMKAIDYALAANHQKTLAVHVAITEEDSAKLQKEWASTTSRSRSSSSTRRTAPTPSPVTAFIKKYRANNGSAVVTVYLPQFIVATGGSRSCTTAARAASRTSSCSCTASRSPWCRGCSTRRSSSTAAGRVPCRASSAVVSPSPRCRRTSRRRCRSRRHPEPVTNALAPAAGAFGVSRDTAGEWTPRRLLRQGGMPCRSSPF